MTGVIWAVLIFSLAQTVLLDSNDNKNVTEPTTLSTSTVKGTQTLCNTTGKETSPVDTTVVSGTPTSCNTTGKGTQTSCNTTGKGTPTSCNTTGNGAPPSNNIGAPPSNNTVDNESWWKKYLTPEHGIPFAAGAGLSAIVCSACCCVIGLCSRRKRRERRDEDKEYPGAALTMVASVDRQRSGSPGLAEDEQAPLRAGGEQGEGGAAGGANADVDYATIDVSQLKKREAADEPGPGADTDYAEIRKERKGGGDRGEGEGEGEGGEEAAAAAGEEGAAENLGAVQQECADAGEQG